MSERRIRQGGHVNAPLRPARLDDQPPVGPVCQQFVRFAAGGDSPDRAVIIDKDEAEVRHVTSG